MAALSAALTKAMEIRSRVDAERASRRWRLLLLSSASNTCPAISSYQCASLVFVTSNDARCDANLATVDMLHTLAPRAPTSVSVQ